MNNIRSLFLVFVYSYSSLVFCTKFGLLIVYKCNKNMILTLSDIFSYAKCTPNTRNFIEADEVLNSNQVILSGKLQVENVSYCII